MILPNKFTNYEESTIFKMLKVLEVCKTNKELSLNELYQYSENYFDCVDEFLYSIDILNILDTIEVDFTKETIRYAQGN